MAAPLLLFLRTAETGSPNALPNREEGEPDRTLQEKLDEGECLAHQAVATGRAAQNASSVAALARFFPDATPVRIPVQITRVVEPGATASFSESTVVEFGTPREVLFACKTPLEFADVLRLKTSDGAFNVDVSVVAVQYHPGNTVIAARFLGDVPNWIVKS